MQVAWIFRPMMLSQSVGPSSDVTRFGKGITWGGVEFC